MEILIILGIGFVFWLFTSKTKKQDMSNAAKGISKSLKLIDHTLDRASKASLQLMFETRLKTYERSNPRFNEITFRNYCRDRVDLNELVEAEILKRRVEHKRLVEIERIKEVVRQINEASKIIKEENISEAIITNIKNEMTPEEVKKEKFRRIDEAILERKQAEKKQEKVNELKNKEVENKQKEVDALKSQETNVRKIIINKEQNLNSQEIKEKIVVLNTSIESTLIFDQSENYNQEDSDIFFSTTKLGKVFGIKAKPDLFDYLVKLNYLEYKNKKYELTKNGFTVGKYAVSDDDAKFPAWNIDKITEIIQPFIKETHSNFGSFNAFYHLTHLENLENILDKGLYCHSHKHEYIDVSNIDVNSRRDKVENIHKNKIHDYVPFYFNVKNAMLYAVQKRFGEHVVILEMDKSLCYRPYTIFCDRNAATYEANFTPYKKDLNQYDWTIIFSENWTNNGVQNLVQKQKMMAECLVKTHVSQSYIKVVHCQTIEIAYTVRNLANQYCMDIDIRVSPELFF